MHRQKQTDQAEKLAVVALTAQTEPESPALVQRGFYRCQIQKKRQQQGEHGGHAQQVVQMGPQLQLDLNPHLVPA